MGKELGQRWATLDKEQKEGYEAMAREEKEKYRVAMANYTPSRE